MTGTKPGDTLAERVAAGNVQRNGQPVPPPAPTTLGKAGGWRLQELGHHPGLHGGRGSFPNSVCCLQGKP